MNRRIFWLVRIAAALPAGFLALAAGCAEQDGGSLPRPSFAPATQPSASLEIDSSQTAPMYQHLLAVDLPTVTRVARARNIDIRQARQRVAAFHGRYESSVEAVFPVIAPSIAGQHFEG